ncbi:MAG TPA: xanthine dehydrogenase family protein molybdopterin-binding subunit [Methylomirabilota bacterium]|nr:xanthine dehydrogenase family protein molybdopterin-binding subunit [Methylomirabilota bacterium]
MSVTRLLGAAVRRREDPALVQGAGRYVDDLAPPRAVALALVRSPHAHARVRAIDTRAAAAMPGVLAVLTARDLEGRVSPEPAVGIPPNARRPPRPLLASGTVRYVGEPVVAVVAESRYVAADGGEAVLVDYEPLPAVGDPEAAATPGAPRVHEEFADNVALRWSWTHGDVDAAFARARHVVRLRLVNQRVAGLAMEPRGCVAEYRPGALTVWAGTQVPHRLRSGLAEMLRLPETAVRVIAPNIGGGFGCKIGYYVDEVLCALAAMRLERPVKLVLTRREDFLTTTQGRGQINDVEAAVARDGTVLALRCRTLADLGAYLEALTPYPGMLTGRLITGPYRIPAAAYELTGVFTNAMATAPYRGAGRPEATYALERTMDEIARVTGLDAAEVRRRNLIRPDEFPYRAPSGLVYDSGQYEVALDRALALADYKRLREEQRRAREEGRLVGIGLSSFMETAGVGPSRIAPMPGWESGSVRVEPSGLVTVLTGTSPHGQGLETAFAQVAADRLGVPIDDVAVLHSDTAVVPAGVGTFGSRSIAVGGPAIAVSVDKILDKARRIAAALLEAAPEDLIWKPGRFAVRGLPDRAATLAQIASAAHAAKALPPGLEPGLEASTIWDPENFTYPSGTHLAFVEVDRATGEIRLLRVVAVDDAGRVINPMLVDGQIHGGLAQGIGQALCEHTVYDEDGQCLTASLMDYAAPRADNLPPFDLDRVETPTPVNPLGAKGCGEAGTIGSTPAVVNAVIDALAPLGVTHLDMPLTPARVWAAIDAANHRRTT